MFDFIDLEMGKNLFPNKGLVKREAKPVIWLTGLSGSGKSTIANELELALEKMAKNAKY